ncbi:hypothetical protein VNO80_26968 [Phaseolus coccineus]|uniref:Uncharacterized protein n=1 Tax=Phaseolus coccineus TaxID=3886 RepID=A0AAN9QH72_PHACN
MDLNLHVMDGSSRGIASSKSLKSFYLERNDKRPSNQGKKEFMKEAKLLDRVHHWNIVNLGNVEMIIKRHSRNFTQKMVKGVAMNIIGHLVKALEIEEMDIRELFEDGIQIMRMNYYPPCPQPEKVIGLLSNHSYP